MSEALAKNEICVYSQWLSRLLVCNDEQRLSGEREKDVLACKEPHAQPIFCLPALTAGQCRRQKQPSRDGVFSFNSANTVPFYNYN